MTDGEGAEVDPGSKARTRRGPDRRDLLTGVGGLAVGATVRI